MPYAENRRATVRETHTDIVKLQTGSVARLEERCWNRNGFLRRPARGGIDGDRVSRAERRLQLLLERWLEVRRQRQRHQNELRRRSELSGAAQQLRAPWHALHRSNSQGRHLP